MLSGLLRSCFSRISVYEGISPSLLATMSLSVNIGGRNHEELIDNLIKAQLVQAQDEIFAFKLLNRQLFTTAPLPYDNKPYPISKGQTMTDIFTHSVIVSNLGPYWRNNMNILQVGTGHGYLAFLIAAILQKKGLKDYKLKALDINQPAINYCKDLQAYLTPGINKINFHCNDLNKFLETDTENKYDVIIGGYYFDETTNDKMINKLSKGGVGIWPTRSQHGQALYKTEQGKERVYLIETMFSLPVVRTEVSKYFFEQGETYESSSTPEKEVEPAKEMDSEAMRKAKTDLTEKLRAELKVLIEKYKKTDGKPLKLQQMKEIPQINDKLLELEKVNNNKTKLKPTLT